MTTDADAAVSAADGVLAEWLPSLEAVPEFRRGVIEQALAAAAPSICAAERQRLLNVPVTDSARKPISHYAIARAGHLSAHHQGYYQAMTDVAAMLLRDTSEPAGQDSAQRAADEHSRLSQEIEIEQQLHDRVAALEQLAVEMLGEFYEKGHPGHPAIRTGWVDTGRIAQWQATLKGEGQ